MFILISDSGKAQFLDNFDKKILNRWSFFTGVGYATMDFVQQDSGFASVLVDATKDLHNVCYAITKRNVTPYLNLKKLAGPGTEH